MKRGRPLPPVYFMIGLLVMVGLHFLLPGPRVIGSPWRLLGFPPLLLGIYLNLAADRLFKKHGTEIEPFQPSTALVVEGPFRYSRNPMYLGGLLIFIGLAVVFGTSTPFIVVPLMFWLATTHFILPEEADMEHQFGNEYLEYKAKVRRWL